MNLSPISHNRVSYSSIAFRYKISIYVPTYINTGQISNEILEKKLLQHVFDFQCKGELRFIIRPQTI